MGRGTKASTKIKRRPPTAEQLVAEKAATIGVPAAQLARGDYALVDVPLRDGGRVVTLKTLVNRGGTPVARWKTAKLLSDSQIAAIDHCERLWAQLSGKGLVMDMDRTSGSGAGDGWSEQVALDDLKRIKGHVPAHYWLIYENVCRFDEPAGTAGSGLANNTRSAIDAARTVVMFVADVIAMKERLV